MWVPGYWWWSTPLNRYVWVGGAWRNPPPIRHGTPGQWVVTPAGRWAWMPGFWAGAAAPPPVAIAVAPPPLQIEVQPPMPAIGFEWTPGFYAWGAGVYVWTPGLWLRPPLVGLLWTEPRYVFSGGHYFFHPGGWDHPFERRGVVYRADIDVRPGAHFRPVAVPGDMVAAHGRFVGESWHAIARGATRTPTGGYTYRHEGAVAPRPFEHGGGEQPGGGGAPHAGGDQPGGFGSHGGGEHGGAPPAVPRRSGHVYVHLL